MACFGQIQVQSLRKLQTHGNKSTPNCTYGGEKSICTKSKTPTTIPMNHHRILPSHKTLTHSTSLGLLSCSALSLLMASILPSTANPVGNTSGISTPRYPRAGWQATLSTRGHSVSGTVTIIDADSFRIDNFTYDGGGINVHFIVSPQDDRTVFTNNRIVTEPNLLGSPFNGGSITIDLPAGTTLDGQNAVSLWCIPAGANFGSGTFRSPLEIWRQSNFGTYANSGDAANDSDFDKDGHSNLLEYATRTNPKIPSANPLNPPSFRSLPGNITGQALTFNYRPEATGLRYIIHQSTNLGTWREVYRNDLSTGTITRAAGVSSEETPTAQTLSVTDAAAGSSSFWRLAVEPAS